MRCKARLQRPQGTKGTRSALLTGWAGLRDVVCAPQGRTAACGTARPSPRSASGVPSQLAGSAQHSTATAGHTTSGKRAGDGVWHTAPTSLQLRRVTDQLPNRPATPVRPTDQPTSQPPPRTCADMPSWCSSSGFFCASMTSIWRFLGGSRGAAAAASAAGSASCGQGMAWVGAGSGRCLAVREVAGEPRPARRSSATT